MTKTWTDALERHENRLKRCQEFGRFLALFESMGGPPPDTVGAGHADWGTQMGVFRLGMHYDGTEVGVLMLQLAKVGMRQAGYELDVKLPAPDEPMNPSVQAVLQAWADLIRREILPTTPPAPPEPDHFAVEEHMGGAVEAARIAATRDKPYR